MSNELFAMFFDVKHGHATYIKTPSGKHIMVDLGTGDFSLHDEAFSPLLHLRNNYGVQQLDQVFITHPHRDHIDDIFNFETMSPRILQRPQHLTEEDVRGGNQQNQSEQSKVEKYLEICRRYTASVADYERPTLPVNNGGVTIQSFQPTQCGRNNLNNHSLVVVVTYGNFKMLIPGDNEKKSWEELLDMQRFKTAIAGTNVMLASHHGRESGFSEELFEHIQPDVVIVSDGPVVDTSVTHYYRECCKDAGVNVWRSASRTWEKRWVLTTRSDDSIRIRVQPSGIWYPEITGPSLVERVDSGLSSEGFVKALKQFETRKRISTMRDIRHLLGRR